jgi:hypothetical protein
MAPVVLEKEHATGAFNSGDPEMDNWLKTDALPAQNNRAGMTYVVQDLLGEIAGFYRISSGSVECRDRIVPALVLNRIAVDTECVDDDLYSMLLAHALVKSLRLAQLNGARLLIASDLNPARIFTENNLAWEKIGGLYCLPIPAL